MTSFTRRNFLKTSVIGGAGATLIIPFNKFGVLRAVENSGSQVSITTGDNRADMVAAIGKRRVVLKPNIVNTNVQLACTHVETMEGVLEFLKAIGKTENVIIAESAANAPTFDGYKNFGYLRLVDKYRVKLVDLDQDAVDIIHVFDEKDFRPHPVRVAHTMLDPDSYIVSVARMKTHDRVFATLSLKNIVVGAPIKENGFTFGSNRKKGTTSDKPLMHGNGFRGINYNLYAMSDKLHPHLAVIDGFDGMEGNGPNDGTPVDHKVCVAGLDWLAVDRVGIELMGIDYSNVGYLNFCGQTGRGTSDLSKIAIIGESIEAHKKTYKLSDNFKDQLIWKNPVSQNLTDPPISNFKLSYT
jgi:uncharacterized protein (DUF362 family)